MLEKQKHNAEDGSYAVEYITSADAEQELTLVQNGTSKETQVRDPNEELVSRDSVNDNVENRHEPLDHMAKTNTKEERRTHAPLENSRGRYSPPKSLKRGNKLAKTNDQIHGDTCDSQFLKLETCVVENSTNTEDGGQEMTLVEKNQNAEPRVEKAPRISTVNARGRYFPPKSQSKRQEKNKGMAAQPKHSERQEVITDKNTDNVTQETTVGELEGQEVTQKSESGENLVCDPKKKKTQSISNKSSTCQTTLTSLSDKQKSSDSNDDSSLAMKVCFVHVEKKNLMAGSGGQELVPIIRSERDPSSRTGLGIDKPQRSSIEIEQGRATNPRERTSERNETAKSSHEGTQREKRDTPVTLMIRYVTENKGNGGQELLLVGMDGNKIDFTGDSKNPSSEIDNNTVSDEVKVRSVTKKTTQRNQNVENNLDTGMSSFIENALSSGKELQENALAKKNASYLSEQKKRKTSLSKKDTRKAQKSSRKSSGRQKHPDTQNLSGGIVLGVVTFEEEPEDSSTFGQPPMETLGSALDARRLSTEENEANDEGPDGTETDKNRWKLPWKTRTTKRYSTEKVESKVEGLDKLRGTKSRCSPRSESDGNEKGGNEKMSPIEAKGNILETKAHSKEGNEAKDKRRTVTEIVKNELTLPWKTTSTQRCTKQKVESKAKGLDKLRGTKSKTSPRPKGDIGEKGGNNVGTASKSRKSTDTVIAATVFKKSATDMTGIKLKRSRSRVVVSGLSDGSMFLHTPLKIGDEIVAVNNVPRDGKSAKDISAIIRRAKGSLTILAKRPSGKRIGDHGFNIGLSMRSTTEEIKKQLTNLSNALSKATEEFAGDEQKSAKTSLPNLLPSLSALSTDLSMRRSKSVSSLLNSLVTFRKKPTINHEEAALQKGVVKSVQRQAKDDDSVSTIGNKSMDPPSLHEDYSGVVWKSSFDPLQARQVKKPDNLVSLRTAGEDILNGIYEIGRLLDGKIDTMFFVAEDKLCDLKLKELLGQSQARNCFRSQDYKYVDFTVGELLDESNIVLAIDSIGEDSCLGELLEQLNLGGAFGNVKDEDSEASKYSL